MNTNLDNIKIVLVEPTHPGNIGAVARSMKTMGLSRLVLVKPREFPHYDASRRAAGADSVLEAALVVDNAEQAIADSQLVFGTSVRDREVNWPTSNPKQTAEQVVEALAAERSVAIMFGRESRGLMNQELDLCHAQIRIPANDVYSSLNLASAVQIVAYEIYTHWLLSDRLVENTTENLLSPKMQRQQLATRGQLEGHIQHLQETLQQLDFIKNNPPTKLMRKLTRLYNKAQLSVEEVQILRGILTAMQTKLPDDVSE